MASRIIGVLGKKRHGKDTFATRLTEEHGFTRYAFADALREAALALDPLIVVEPDEMYLLPWGAVFAGLAHDYVRLSELVRLIGWERAKEIREVRRTLQRMGVGVRELDPDFWVRVVMDAVDNHRGPIVITDVRFSNEVGAVITRPFGRTVRVINPRVPVSLDQHISETALDLYVPDHVIMNSGTIEDLHRYADRIAALS
jgi:hypothetical protein